MPHLIDAHFFFVDVVGLSDPTMSTTDQLRRLSFLYSSISECAAFKDVLSDDKLIFPTGDGVAIGFLRRPELPLELAIELHQKIRECNKGRVYSESLYVRIGIHNGPVFVIKDMKGNDNIWGPGIIETRRIMDLGEENHILVSDQVAKMLSKLSPVYGQYLHELGKHVFKHDIEMIVHSAYLNSEERVFGNENWPKKMKPRIPTFLYPYIEVNMTIVDPESMLVHYKRIQEIENGTEVPVRTVKHEIATDIPTSWDDLNIKVVDDKGKELEWELGVDYPNQKSFETSFAEPLGFGDRRLYSLEYDLREPDRSFENLFLVKCGKFVAKIDYPANSGINPPTVYEVNSEKKTKEKSLVQPSLTLKTGNRCLAEWSTDDCYKQRLIRFEW